MGRRKRPKKLGNPAMEDQYVSLTNTFVDKDPEGGSPTHRYECLGCDKTERLTGGRQAENAIKRKAQSHRCKKFNAGEEDYLDRGRKDLN